MNDYVNEFHKYKDIKEIADIIDEVNKLREYYFTRQYGLMHQHIEALTKKYFTETFLWNSTHQAMPTTTEQAYGNAETFLRLKGLSVLIKNGIDLRNQLTEQENAFIEATFKPTESGEKN